MLSQNIIFEIAYAGIVFFLSLSLSLVLVPVSGRLGRVFGMLDHPDARKVHPDAVPRMGGLAMAISMVVAIFLAMRPGEGVKAFLLGAGIICFTGLMDDKLRISPMMKLVGQVLAASAFVMAGGFKLYSFGDIFGVGVVRTGVFASWVTVFCMVGVINAINLSDGLDGLAGGLGVIVSMFLAVIALEIGQGPWVVVALVLVGVLLGFLRYNHYPAKLFMGDTGSLLIGYSLAAISVALAGSGVEPVTPAILLGLPIIDTLWVMGGRVIGGRHPLRPDRSHFHHRLLELGMGHAGTVAIVYGLMVFLGFWACFTRGFPEWVRFYSTLLIFGVIYGALLAAEKRGARIRWPGRMIPRMEIKGHRVLRAVFRKVPLALMGCLVLPVFLMMPIPRIIGVFSFGAALFIGLLYPWRSDRKTLLLAHGVLYAACFFLLLIYRLSPNAPPWVMPFSYGVSIAALVWVVLKVITGHRDPILYPSGFELLIMCFSWVVPFLLLPALNVGQVARAGIIIACIQSLPWLVLLKLSVRRNPVRNAGVVVGFISVFLFVTGAAFLY